MKKRTSLLQEGVLYVGKEFTVEDFEIISFLKYSDFSTPSGIRIKISLNVRE
jgi:hypothetical protein